MSASLVGSEMCIRDRCSFGFERLQHFRTCSGQVGAARWTSVRWSHRRGPVSYTHLTLPTICSV
eukprot:12022637-Alexandrium_andersonii.AAC.1